jgi:glycerol-3-phosphate dehydrogenase
LSFDKGWLDDPAQRLPNHSWLSRKAALAKEPVLEQPGFDGALQYYDAQMYSPERLALECLLDADANGAAIANYVEGRTLLSRDGNIEGCHVRDLETDNAFDVRAKLTLVAAGPWADIFLEHALGKPSTHKLMRSKGIHLLVPAVTRTSALTVAAEGSHFFVLPWHSHTLLGTTDTEFKNDPDDVGVSESDIANFLAFVSKHLPAAKLTRDKVEFFYAGLRPLVDDGSGDTYGASRRAELVDHGESDGLTGLLSAIGGKWTTSRALAQSVVDAVVEKLDVSTSECETDEEPTAGGDIGRLSEFFAEQRSEHGDLPSVEHLARMYGSRLPEMLAQANNRPELRLPLGSSGDIAAQVVFAIREEMALHLSDVVMRRTCVGQFGTPQSAALDTTSRIMAAELGWSEEHRNTEIAALAPWFKTRPTA